MPTIPTLWTLNGLVVELKIHRAKLASQLATLPPDDVDERGSQRWLMHRVVTHLLALAAGDKKLDQNHEGARLKRAQADKLERENALREGEIVKTEDVGEYVLGLLLACRSRLLALPKRLAPVVTGMKRAADVQARIETDVFSALNELAALDPEKMVKEIRAKYQKEDEHDEAAP